MIEFKGVLSDEVRNKEIKSQAKSFRNRSIILTIVSFVFYLMVVLTKTIFSNEKFSFSALYSGEITLFFLLLFIASLGLLLFSIFKPRYNSDLDKKTFFSVTLDNDKIVYTPENSFGKREFNYSNLKKIVDEGSYYVLISKEHNIRLVCEKDLLVQGSLEEFDNYFSKIIDKGGNYIEKDKTVNKQKSLSDNESLTIKVNDEGTSVKEANEKSDVENSLYNNAEKSEIQTEKTFAGEKFKGSKTKNEKSFKFALIGIILGVLAVALTPIIVIYGIGFATSAISHLFDSLFYGGFVVEFFTFLFAVISVFISAVVLFPACVLIMPALALLSLIFPIYQLIAVNRRWFSWVSLAVGILSVIGCLVLAITTVQGL